MLIVSYDQTLCGQYINHMLTMEGHANHSEIGTDIVCAAASILVQTLAYILSQNTDDYVITKDNDIITSINYKARYDDESINMAFRFAVEGLELLAEDFPDNVSVQG